MERYMSDSASTVVEEAGKASQSLQTRLQLPVTSLQERERGGSAAMLECSAPWP